ncbi:hypothetical protein K5549_011260 [Capra hircus]|nr:hypothetical protein K5549_011260 [Capra hircus]
MGETQFSPLHNVPLRERLGKDMVMGHVGTTATKKIDVYLPLHSSQDRLLPMTVVTMASARVQDLIGLICWQYTSEGREPKLNDNVSAYCLHIAEDDGEVDTDFPPLDSNEPIHKFGFSTLALVEKYSSPGLTSKESLFVRINAAHGFSLIQVDNTKVTMKEILLKAVKRRKGSQKISGPQYRLEKQSEPNIAVDLESTLESQSAWEFCLVRENSSRADGVFEEDSQIDIATVQDMLSSHHYKSFKVSMIHRLRFTTDVQLGQREADSGYRYLAFSVRELASSLALLGPQPQHPFLGILYFMCTGRKLEF